MMENNRMQDREILPLESWYGGQIDVYPTRILPDLPLDMCLELPPRKGKYPDFALNLDPHSFRFVSKFLDKYLNQELLPQYRNVEIDGYSFDHYNDNVYRYSDIQQMLTEINNTAQDILQGRITDLIRLFIVPKCDPFIFKEEYTSNFDRNRLFENHRNIIADYLIRFCNAVQAVMDNAPEFELISFQGP